MADGLTSYEGFYDGGVSSLSPDSGNFTGYRMTAAQLGFPGSPQTANQLGEAINAAKQGVKAFEVTMLQGETAETIPKEHFKEMRALMKLTGVKPSVHGPMIDAAGFDEKGNYGNGFGRADNERRMFDTMEKAAMLDSKGNVPVVFHSAGVGTPGAEFRPGDEKLGEKKEVIQRGVAINQETGQAIQLKREYKFRPGHPELLEKGGNVVSIDKSGKYKYDFKEGVEPGLLFDAEGSVGAANRGEWENKLMEVAQMNKHAEEIMGDAHMKLGKYSNAEMFRDGNKTGYRDIDTGEKLPDINASVDKKASYNQMRKADLFLENAELAFQGG